MFVTGPHGLRVSPQAQLRVDGAEEGALPRPGGDPVREVPGQRDEVQTAVRLHEAPRRRIRFGREPTGENFILCLIQEFPIA